MSFIDLFPTTILSKLLNDSISIKDITSYKSYLYNETYLEGDQSRITVNQKLLDLPIFTSLKKQILTQSKTYLDSLGHIYEDLQISNSWGTKTNKGEQSFPHSHSNSYISGVYYLTEGSDIIFSNPLKNPTFNPMRNYIKGNPRSYNSYSIQPQSNLLLLFSSQLVHQVEKSNIDNRLSIAFNIIPKGEFGELTQRLYL